MINTFVATAAVHWPDMGTMWKSGYDMKPDEFAARLSGLEI